MRLINHSPVELARRFDMNIFIEEYRKRDVYTTRGIIIPLDSRQSDGYNGLGLLLQLIDPSRAWYGSEWTPRHRSMIYDAIRERYPSFTVSLIYDELHYYDKEEGIRRFRSALCI